MNRGEAFMLGRRAADHFVLGLPHTMPLVEGIRWLESLTGIRAAIGGRHIGRGTHNAVASLGRRMYLELLAVDPGQPEGPSWMGMEICPGRPRIVAWAVRPNASLHGANESLEKMVKDGKQAAYDAGAVQSFSRGTPSGTEMKWSLAYNHYRQPLPGGGVVPFLIVWGDAAAPPMDTAPTGLSLQRMRVMHPATAKVVKIFHALGLEHVEVIESADPCVELELISPKGLVNII